MQNFQKTIRHTVNISGVGLHTGEEVTLTIKPAPVDYGYKIQRIDLEGQPTLKADADLVADTSRGTLLEQNGVKVGTIEHVLAALVGSDLDNIHMELTGSEMPIMDGSSKPFMELLVHAGIEEQKAEREYLEIDQTIRYYNKEKDVEMIAMPADDYQVTVMIDFNSPVLGKQHASMLHINEFAENISSCRTFCFLHELELLLQHNLIKGGDLNNAIVVVDKPVSEEELKRLAKIFNKANISVQSEGILNNIDLRFQNEPARHKLLDVVGDLALVGTHIKGRILASKPGHMTNVEFAKILKRIYKDKKQLKEVPKYDPNSLPIKDLRGIEKMLPHRFPFLLVDKIIELSDKHVVGVKSVTYNEYFFQGHFPGNPVMPGVLQVEALAQTGGVLALSTVEDPENWDTYFVKIEEAKFKRMVLPGDTLLLKMELISPIRRGLVEMKGTAYVGNNIVTEGVFLAKIQRRN
jgi:UDP-3-O-[3-hydroxymyristoyl] N-acetylglucosamine deacetylase/3-hydroxyacyl-[acyl-carrier-protein] dehydratase